jgi:hypothetical protein
VKAATLRAGQAPRVVTVATRPGAPVEAVQVGLDGEGRPVVSWTVAPGIIGFARGDGTGAFAPALEQALDTAPLSGLRTFVQASGDVLALWAGGTASKSAVKSAVAPAGSPFGPVRTVISGKPGRPPAAFAANASGRAAVIFPTASGSGTTLRVVLRSTAGNWGSSRTLGATGRFVSAVNAGVSSDGRVVALWDDGSTSATRILAARSSSPTSSLSAYDQVPQRSGETRCNLPSLFLSSRGDGRGLWQCATSSSGAINQPRLARLTAP